MGFRNTEVLLLEKKLGYLEAKFCVQTMSQTPSFAHKRGRKKPVHPSVKWANPLVDEWRLSNDPMRENAGQMTQNVEKETIVRKNEQDGVNSKQHQYMRVSSDTHWIGDRS